MISAFRADITVNCTYSRGSETKTGFGVPPTILDCRACLHPHIFNQSFNLTKKYKYSTLKK